MLCSRWVRSPSVAYVNVVRRPKGSRTGFGSLHLAQYRGTELKYLGSVGSGFRDAEIEQLAPHLTELEIEACPCVSGPVPKGRGHHWVRPEIVAEVKYKELTDQGMVRQASFFAAFLPEGTPVGPDGQVGTFYFPNVDTNSAPTLTAGNSAAAFRDAPEVWAVMEYLGSSRYAEERQKAQREIKGGDASGFLTSNLNVDLGLWTELEGGFIAILASADPARFDGSDLMPAAVGAGTFWTEGTSAVNGDKTVEEAFAAIDASWPSN